MERFPDHLTYGDKYGPAMEMTDPVEAEAYFEQCVEHTMRHGYPRDEAEVIERQNLGYYAGYYNQETRRRVELLFRCVHPIFGSAAHPPTPERAVQAGIERGRPLRDQEGDSHA